MSNGKLHVMMLSSIEMKMSDKELSQGGSSHLHHGLSLKVPTEKLSSPTFNNGPGIQ